jgi:hypothetical protein
MEKSLALLAFAALFAACAAEPTPTSAPTADIEATVVVAVAEELQMQSGIDAANAKGLKTGVTPAPTLMPSVAPTATVFPNATPTSSIEASFALLVSEPIQGIPSYDRGDWRHWIDADGDCQNTRAEALIDESLSTVAFDGCRVISGQWVGLYTGTSITDASSLDVDHMVPLANAHASGGWAWDATRKRAFANDLGDPDHLIAVTASANRSKGAKGPENWRPPDASYWCEYATDWARIKVTWDLSVTSAELIAMRDMLGVCPSGVEIVAINNPGLVPELSPTATVTSVDGALLYDPFGPDRNCGDFSRWVDAQAFYVAAGGPAIDRHRLDGDGDGVACTSLAGAP